MTPLASRIVTGGISPCKLALLLAITEERFADLCAGATPTDYEAAALSEALGRPPEALFTNYERNSHD